jgi:hypothetical protein
MTRVWNLLFPGFVLLALLLITFALGCLAYLTCVWPVVKGTITGHLGGFSL